MASNFNMNGVNHMKTFNPLNVSSKFAICGLPIRIDTYKNCGFGCKYCFSNSRIICEFDKALQIANLKQIEHKLDKIFNKQEYSNDNFLDTLIAQQITWHCGGMSDPFQPVEYKYHVTRDMIDICNKYGISILFSTKSDTVYDANINPNLHTFQLSVTNVNNNKVIEPGVPNIEKRYSFYRSLKDNGFRVGIRIQPFIPGVTTLDIAEMFHDADNFTLEGLKLVPQNKEHKDFLIETLKLDKAQFKQMGLLNLKPDIRLEMYKPFIDFFEQNDIPFSIADNDLHHIGTNSCCCGDRLVAKSTTFNNTAMIKQYGIDYTKQQIDREICSFNCGNCKANQLFTSNRQEGCVTVQEFYDKRFDRKSSPFSPKFLYKKE